MLIEQALQHIKAIVDESEKTGAVLTTDVKGSKNDVKGYTIDRKARLLDRWLDAVVRASGSEIVFFTILAGIFAWAFLGISFHDTLDWQVLISDIQAILSYMFDSLLMRQQLNSYDETLAAAAQLRSRALSNRRMLGIS